MFPLNQAVKVYFDQHYFVNVFMKSYLLVWIQDLYPPGTKTPIVLCHLESVNSSVKSRGTHKYPPPVTHEVRVMTSY